MKNSLLRALCLLAAPFFAALASAQPAVTINVSGNAITGTGTAVVNLTTAALSENTVTFTLTWDPAVLTYVSDVAGSAIPTDGSATITRNKTQTSAGKLGLLIGLEPGTEFTAGTKQLLAVTFAVAGSGAATTNLSFVDFATVFPKKKVFDKDGVTITSATFTDAVIAANTLPVAPTITTPPANQSVTSGGNATFTVVAAGSPAPAIKWQKGTVDLLNGGRISGATTSTLTITGALTADAGSYRAVATYGTGSATSTDATLTVNKAAQTIDFPVIANKTFADPTFTLGASASSGLSVIYTSATPAVATVTGNVVTVVGPGTSVITASQAGNSEFNAAANATQTLTVNKATATVALAGLTPTFDNTPKAVTATTNPAGRSVTITYDGSATAPTVAGSYAVVATVNDANYAGTANGTLVIGKANQTITFGSLTQKLFNDAPFTLNATATSALGVSYASSNPAVATVAGNTVSIVGVGNTTLTATQSGNGNFNAAPPATQVLTVANALQTITFAAIPARTFVANDTFTLGATASSTLAVSYASDNPLVATVTGSTVTVVGAGTTTLTAKQAGSANFGPAPDVTQVLTINKAAATVSLATLAATYDGTAKSATATTTPSGLTVTFTYAGSATAPTAAGTYAVVATVVDANFAGTVSGSLVIAKATQTVTFAALTDVSFGAAAFDLTATTTSPLAVAYSSSNAAVASVVGKTISVVGVGTTTITASQSGDSNYLAATAVDRVLTVNKATATVALAGLTPTFDNTPKAVTATTTPAGRSVTITYDGSATAPTVAGSYAVVATVNDASYAGTANGTLVIGKANQTITFGLLSQKLFTDAPFTLNATATSALGVSYASSNPAVATVTGNTVTIVGVGNTTLTATQSGNGNFNAAPPATQVLTVANALQTITFAAIPARTFVVNDTFTLGATASSTLAVSYASDNPLVATVTGSTVTVVGAGTTTLTAKQAGSANFGPAPDVTQVLTINKAAATVSLAALAATYDGTAKSATATTTPSGLTVTFTYAGSATAPTAAGTYAVVATVDDSNYSGTASGSLVISKASQAITFGPLAATTFTDAAFDLAATTTSPLAVSYSSSNTAVATISGKTVTVVGAGSANITASQAGNANYLAAANVIQALVVNKATAPVTLGNLAATYDATPKAATATPVPAGLTVTLTYAGSVTVPTNAGTYAVVGTINDANYAGTASGNLVIAQAPLTGSFMVENKPYDGLLVATVAQRSVAGAIQGDDVVLAGGSASFGSAAAGSGKTVTLSGAALSGTKASNYTLSSVSTATATITPKQLTASGLSAVRKSYDGSTSAVLTGSAALVGVVSGDDVSLTGTPLAAFANPNAGDPKSVLVSGLSLVGTLKDNYSLAPISLSAAIDKVPLTVKAEDQTKGYDGQVFAASGHAVTYAGFVNNESPAVLGGILSYAGAAAATANAGQHAITPVGLSSPNYTLTFVDGRLTITRRALAIRARDDSKVYGAVKTYGTSVAFTQQGLVTGQSIGSVTITPSGGATANAAVGTYDLIPTAATGGTFLPANYDITYVNGALTVSRFGVSGSFIVQNKIYDGGTAATVASTSLTGVRSGDAVALTGGVATFQSSGVGDGKKVDLRDAVLTGVNAGNYVLTAVQASSANISLKPLTVGGLSAANKIYDGTTAATVSGVPLLQGKVGDDVVNLAGTPVGTFATATAGSSKGVAISGYSLTGAAANNYSLTLPSLSADITKADQTVSIVSVLKRAATDPDFTIDVLASSKLTNFTYSSSAPGVAAISAAGLIDLLTQGTTTITVTQPGDGNFAAATATGTLSVVASGQTLVWDATVLSGKKFGDSPITLSATASSNLPVTFTSSNSAVAAISGNTLTIIGAGSAAIIAKQVGNDAFGAAEKKTAMTVAKASATVSLTGLAATYNGSPKSVIAETNPAGLKVNLLYGAAPGSASAPTNAGSYAVTATIDEANFSGVDASKTLVIAKAAQTITFPVLATKSVDDLAFLLNATASSGLPVSVVSSNPLVAAIGADNGVKPVSAGSVTITARQAGNENFNPASAVSQPLTVEPLLPDFSIPAPSAVAIQGSSFLFGPVSLNARSAPAVFSASANLPAGLKIDAATGNISGTPTAATGTAVAVIITATNAKGLNSKPVAITVQPPAPVITSAAAAVATAGQPFSYSTFAAPSTGLTFVVSPASAPAGWNSLAISAAGVLTGTPLKGGAYVFTITATNATGSASLPLLVTVNLPADAPAYAGVTNPSAQAGTFFTFTPNFGTSAQPTTYSLSGELPSGLSFSAATGQISGTTQSAGAFPVLITATRGGLSATASLTLVVNPAENAPVATIVAGSVRTGTVGTFFSVTVTAVPEPTGFTVGAAPLADAGLLAGAFNSVAKSIVISGIPTRVGTFLIPISAQNTAGTGPPTTLGLTVNPHPEAPQVVSTPSLTVRVGEAMTPFTLAAKSAGADIVPPNVTFALLGTLPVGLGFDGATGVLSGEPAAGTTGVYKAMFAATKVGTVGATGLGLEITINVLPPLSVPEITSNGSAAGQVGQGFTYAIAATNEPTTYSATPLPAGLVLNGAVISGVPSSATGSVPFKVKLSAANADGTGNPKELAIAIAPAPATPVVTSALSATGRVGSVFGYRITASASPTSYVALNLPPGLVLDVVSGQISGSPTLSGYFTATIRVANVNGLGAAESLLFSINSAPAAPVVSSAPTATGEVGAQTSYLITASPGPISSYSVAGNLPPGLELNSSTGLIKGSPAQAGTFEAAVAATGSGGTSLAQSVIFTIKPSALAPLIASPGTAVGNVGTPFSYTIEATNAPLVTRDAVNLPEGLVVNPFTGQITGTPSAVGTTVASLVATNSVGAGPIRDLTIQVGPSLSSPVISGATTVSAQVGVSFSYAITANGNPTSFELSGAPAWMLLKTETGVINGTPTAPNSFSVSALARNSAGVSAPFALTVNVAPAKDTPVIVSSQTASGTVGVPFDNYTARSDPAATSYLASGLPPGLSLNGTTGAITGTPTASGTFVVSVSGTNAKGQGGAVKVTLTIAPSITFGN